MNCKLLLKKLNIFLRRICISLVLLENVDDRRIIEELRIQLTKGQHILNQETKNYMKNMRKHFKRQSIVIAKLIKIGLRSGHL